jgi:peroxiredoxin
MHVQIGDVIKAQELPSLDGAPIALPDPRQVVHLQFRRYAGCPICNLHLREFVTRRTELETAGIHEVIVFHSTRDDLAEYQSELPFDVVPDPHKRLYAEFGVERSYRAIAHPRTWLAAVRGWSPRLGVRAGAGGHLGMPADFLIAADGRVLAEKYGTHADDSWNVDTVLTHWKSLSSR